MEESSESVEAPIIGMISRKTLKKELRPDYIEDFYLATIRRTNDDMEINISARATRAKATTRPVTKGWKD